MNALNLQCADRARRGTASALPVDPDRARADEYSLMAAAYSSRGGLLTAEEVLAWMRTETDAPISAIARPIAQRDLVSFTWRGQLLLPAFQFGRHDVRVKVGVVQVVAELRSAFDDWDVALWFASRNSWLNGVRPADAVDRNEAAVLSAARADRYVRAG